MTLFEKESLTTLNMCYESWDDNVIILAAGTWSLRFTSEHCEVVPQNAFTLGLVMFAKKNKPKIISINMTNMFLSWRFYVICILWPESNDAPVL